MKKGNLKGNVWILKNDKNVAQERSIINYKPVLKKRKIIPHIPRKVRQCNLCPFRARLEPSFEQHMRHHENEADPQSKCLECPQCPSKFSTQQLFNFHQECHQGLHKLRCDICSKIIPPFSLADHLISHFPSDGGMEPPPKIIYCQNCSFCCTSRQTYLLHLNRHKCKITKGIFSCDICSEQFSMTNDLLKHLHDKHEGSVEKWPCDFPNCDKVLVSRNALVTHKWGHCREKIFNCLACDKKFASKLLLECTKNMHIIF